MIRGLVLLVALAAAACGGGGPSAADVHVVEAGLDSPHPFPNIEASTLAVLKEAACGWAMSHSRAPERADADTTVV